MNIEEIKKVLPHRYPFLLVDRVLEVDETNIKAYKNVTANEEFFNGHFPGQPIMPGVLQVEALAQAGAIMLMTQQVDNPQETLMVFTGINKCKFRKQVVPGDQLMLEVELGSKKRNFVTMKGIATVDGKVTCELEASAALVPREKV
ncbi:MAG: 3-hydroxyacyl-ACP dehydratase FabZ [Gracilimonas sp.]|uniref:3-hydroxyacyl-ACP dehydratase FabZ n=1 Tax=Gracilimonas sp. TaxID=1974203 RepID=UPI0019CE9CEB|nr:3-hydroxyacyl-ACP dehydratase FabZ [Gracilimonas sp.]MBD3616462.1 3-hydroxyacyl-ACP dehydratase FabZ [Gracilimonas sp.]